MKEQKVSRKKQGDKNQDTIIKAINKLFSEIF